MFSKAQLRELCKRLVAPSGCLTLSCCVEEANEFNTSKLHAARETPLVNQVSQITESGQQNGDLLTISWRLTVTLVLGW